VGGEFLIVIDTHIWIWWVHGHTDLKDWMRQSIAANENDFIGVSAISLWEIARLVAGGRLDLGRDTGEWFAAALSYPGVTIVDLTPQICIDANNLPVPFHKDPVDRLIVATARTLNCELLTADGKIRGYSHVKTVSSGG
jgi:PIN domain nuclease of toxin-antitoxin system